MSDITQATGNRTTPVDPDAAGRMSLADHLIELRKRLLISVVVIFAMTIASYFMWENILDLIMTPYCRLDDAQRDAVTGECRVFNFDIGGQFLIRLKVSLVGGVILAGPIWLYQLWAFIAPGLHKKERRYGLAFVFVSVALFALGTGFAYLTLDRGLEFLLNVGGDQVENLLDINRYFAFVTLMLLAFGISFEFPLLLIVLNMMGVVTTARMRSSRRTVGFLVALFAAVITPSQDPFTFAAMAVPMYVFYEAAIVFGRLNDRAKRRRIERDPLAQLADDEMSEIDERPSAIDDRPSNLDDLDLDDE